MGKRVVLAILIALVLFGIARGVVVAQMPIIYVDMWLPSVRNEEWPPEFSPCECVPGEPCVC